MKRLDASRLNAIAGKEGGPGNCWRDIEKYQLALEARAGRKLADFVEHLPMHKNSGHVKIGEVVAALAEFRGNDDAS